MTTTWPGCRPRPSEGTMFTDEQRRVFKYFDGASWVYGDPLEMKRRFAHELGGDANKVLADMDSELEPLRYEATERVLAAVRLVFQMRPFDRAEGSGADEEHCLQALDALLAYPGAQTKTAAISPITSPPTAPTGPYPRTMEPLSG